MSCGWWGYRHRSLVDLAAELASEGLAAETAPWSLPQLAPCHPQPRPPARPSPRVAISRSVGRAAPCSASARPCTAAAAVAARRSPEVPSPRVRSQRRSAGYRGRRSARVRGPPHLPRKRSCNAAVVLVLGSVNWPAVRTDRPQCRPGRRPSRSADPTARRTASTGPGWPPAVIFSNIASTSKGGGPIRTPAPPAADVGGVQPGCMPAMTSSVSKAEVCCPPGSATATCGPSGSGTASPGAGRSPAIAAGRWPSLEDRRSRRPSMSGIECPGTTDSRPREST